MSLIVEKNVHKFRDSIYTIHTVTIFSSDEITDKSFIMKYEVIQIYSHFLCRL